MALASRLASRLAVRSLTAIPCGGGPSRSLSPGPREDGWAPARLPQRKVRDTAIPTERSAAVTAGRAAGPVLRLTEVVGRLLWFSRSPTSRVGARRLPGSRDLSEVPEGGLVQVEPAPWGAPGVRPGLPPPLPWRWLLSSSAPSPEASRPGDQTAAAPGRAAPSPRASRQRRPGLWEAPGSAGGPGLLGLPRWHSPAGALAAEGRLGTAGPTAQSPLLGQLRSEAGGEEGLPGPPGAPLCGPIPM